MQICGVIKQTQSEVGQIQFSFFLLKLYAPISELHFAENPIEICQLVPKIWAHNTKSFPIWCNPL